MQKKISTEPYKGVRDFYPRDLAIREYIFKVWSQTVEQFGYERYDASVFEPAELYRSKTSEEIVNEQTYTFIDRGDREVTLRPEMTPTVARMVAGKKRDLVMPLRWYSIPNLFRYERPQRGRLREHWQLNCDLFGSDDTASDVEMVCLADQLLKNFGLTSDEFIIRINDRKEMTEFYASIGLTDPATINILTRLIDRKNKLPLDDFKSELGNIVPEKAEAVLEIINAPDKENEVTKALDRLGLKNVILDRSLARGFDYYTGMVFEIFSSNTELKRALLGGGRYDNLTGLFSDEPVSGVGFGMGDVSLLDLLESTGKLPQIKTGPKLMIIPTDSKLNLDALALARAWHECGIATAVDYRPKALGKRLQDADKRRIPYVMVFGTDEVVKAEYTVKNLTSGESQTGSFEILKNRLVEETEGRQDGLYL